MGPDGAEEVGVTLEDVDEGGDEGLELPGCQLVGEEGGTSYRWTVSRHRFIELSPCGNEDEAACRVEGHQCESPPPPGFELGTPDW